VNGKRADIPSILLRPGDTVTIKEKDRDGEKFKAVLEASLSRPVPQWLDLNREAVEGKITQLPEREQIAVPVEEHLIVEFYSK
jgi:small subunit ribosomal protein S4